MPTLTLPPVPPQLADANAGWFNICYKFLKSLVAFLVAFTGGVGSLVVYQPGGTASSFVHTSFASAWTAAASLYDPVLYVDDTFGTPVVTAATYQMPARMTMASDEASLVLNPGAVFVPSASTDLCVLNLDLITLQSEATGAAIFQIPSTAELDVYAGPNAALQSVGGATTAMISVAAGGGICKLYVSGGTLAGINGAPIVTTGAGGSAVDAYLGQGATVTDHTFGGTGTIVATLYDSSVSYSMTQPAATLVSWIAGGGTVGAHVFCNSVNGQSIASGAPVNITNYAAGTNVSPVAGGSLNLATGIFTCPLTGYYTVTMQAAYGANPSGGTAFPATAGIAHNATGVASATVTVPGAGGSVGCGVNSLYCTSGDTIVAKTGQTSGGAIPLTESVGAVGGTTYLSIEFTPY